MNPGSNSYVTVAEADEYAANTHPEIRWFALSRSQKEQRLELACERLEALPFPGRRADPEQALSFPRFPGITVPWSIKAAQMEIAMLDMREDGDTADAAKRASLQRQGVTAFSIGDLSESYGTSGLVAIHDFLADTKIHGLLIRFLQGGYSVC